MWPHCEITETHDLNETHSILVRGIEVSTGHIAPTSSLRFHLAVFVRTYGEEAELSFDFEAEDMHAAGDKVLEVSRRISECPGVLYWKILSVVQIRTAGPQ
jgi:hypothetical protein